ncbi:MAG: hypothetical protein KKH94_11050 [Candidatus Omnitrophica bacterium]|nr:hypothetical protein [Candidatus Omnitrophota bacterium]
MEKILSLLAELKLHNFLKNFEHALERYPDCREKIIKILEELCRAELACRKERTITYRIEQAKFGQIQTIDTFDFKYNASTLKRILRIIKTVNFI